jgi:hypothetical protein
MGSGCSCVVPCLSAPALFAGVGALGLCCRHCGWTVRALMTRAEGRGSSRSFLSLACSPSVPLRIAHCPCGHALRCAVVASSALLCFVPFLARAPRPSGAEAKRMEGSRSREAFVWIRSNDGGLLLRGDRHKLGSQGPSGVRGMGAGKRRRTNGCLAARAPEWRMLLLCHWLD